MTFSHIKAPADSALYSALRKDRHTYSDMLISDERDGLVVFDLSTVPEVVNEEQDSTVVAALLRAEARGGVLYTGFARRNFIVNGLETVRKGEFGVLGLVSTGVPSIG